MVTFGVAPGVSVGVTVGVVVGVILGVTVGVIVGVTEGVGVGDVKQIGSSLYITIGRPATIWVLVAAEYIAVVPVEPL